MRVTPDRYLTYRYAGASGDFNPIHLDDEFARSVGLHSRILHGLWTMAQFRGMGVPEQEIVVRSRGEGDVECEAVQGDSRLVRRGKAVVRMD